MTDTVSSPVRLPIGSIDAVEFDVVAWGPAHADVDFSVACMFEHELGAGMAGGLLALDQALGGALSRLRAAGAFRAQPMETLLVTTPPPGVTPRAVLVIGMGDPALLDGDVLRRACRVALREAIRYGAESMAFAPSVLDAGHTDNAALNMQEVMLDGMMEALRAEHMVAEAGLARAPVLRHCTFDVGAPRLQAAGRAFAEAFARLTAAQQAASGARA
ncbi:M17 family peptidase N-terminal domain-containing protein [Massilia putida]|uniref:M17 family peptidase N-terminal domain-containing protein n=1 Tax=Massilia putida TaxID=1141883 RepID=UPI0009521409|nr:M17 family peptidase N-terminal domain-containing protein [Massilia putida]